MPKILKTTDNNLGKLAVTEEEIEDLKEIGNKKISELKDRDSNQSLLIFPDNSSRKDKIEDKEVFSLSNEKLTTHNIMGFIGRNKTQLTIQSRFAQNNKDYFLHYMLQKVLSINLFDLKHNSEAENIFDFLLYLFPYYLKKALRQGLYKEYRKNEYNNANVKGTIDVNNHIRNNIPFNGKIFYRVREHSYDNKITQLVRHTIEYIKKKPLGHSLLTTDPDTQNYVMQIVQATPSYSYNQRSRVINKNIRPMVHPYFFEYTTLQKICLSILRHDGLKYCEKNNEIYGLLFDGAWLWEEYLNTILKDCGFTHPENKSKKNPIFLFKDETKFKRYPDFYKLNFIVDAKYKKMNVSPKENNNESDNEIIDDNTNKIKVRVFRDDIHQIIVYMHVQQAKLGGFLYPIAGENCSKEPIIPTKIGELKGYGGMVKTWGFCIPAVSQENGTFKNFCDNIKKVEEKLKRVVVLEKEQKTQTKNKNL